MAGLRVVEVDGQDKGRVRQFLELPFRIYRDCPQWVPPLAGEAAGMLDRRRNPFFEHSEAAFFLVLDRDGEAAGRLAAMDNRRYNEYHGSRTAFFCAFECNNDPEAAACLFGAGGDWARNRGLAEMFGPKGFSVMDGLGLLVKGFEHRPAFAIPYNPPYYPDLLEAAGFEKVGELDSGYLGRRSFRLPEKVRQLAERVAQRRGLRVARFKNRQELRAAIPHLQALYNASLGGTTETVPLTAEEVRSQAEAMLPFIDPSLVKIVFKGEQAAGFVLAYPDISAALQRSRGRLFPLGWADMLLELRRTKWININGAAIIEEQRGLGGTAVLFNELYKTIAESRFEHADLVQVGVENERMQRELRGLGIEFYKRHRTYRLAL